LLAVPSLQQGCGTTPHFSFMTTQQPVPIDLDDVLTQIRDSLLQYPARHGAVKLVIESEAGEEIHVLKIDSLSRASLRTAPTLILSPHLSPAASALRADNSERTETDIHQEQMQTGDHGLLQQCREQQRRIAELELRLQQARDELRQHSPQSPLSLSSSSALPDRPDASPAHSTDDDSSDSLHHCSGGETDGDAHGGGAMTAAAQSSSIEVASSHSPQASADSTAVRRSERSKTNVDRWRPPTQRDASRSPAGPSPSQKKRKTRRHSPPHDHDSEQDISSAMTSMEVDSMDDQPADGAVEVTTLVTKLREGYDGRQSIALDSLAKHSILSLRQHVLEAAGDRLPSISGQITSLISTSTSLKMLGYYLRAILAHRLKHRSQNCYKRLARDMLGIKSPADIAAYPALYELVQYHYPDLASAGIEAWLKNPIFSADITWTEWKHYRTKQGRAIIDAALQQFKASVAPYRDWMQLGWVEIYDDEKLSGQGVRALRDIHMPMSRAKNAQRNLEASISVMAAGFHCAGPECVLDKNATREVDPTYLVQLDRQRVFNASHHWVGKINHLPDRLCNLRLTSSGKLLQIKQIAAGDALTFDYDVDYWVYQLSGMELADWLVSSSVQSNRGTLDLFRQMHESVMDYTSLLSCDWVKRRPAVWSELERELWMGNLVEYLEARRL
jgi:hypothetical protein